MASSKNSTGTGSALYLVSGASVPVSWLAMLGVPKLPAQPGLFLVRFALCFNPFE
jgi:hypothetical protein